jgi:hypothetical protein
MADPVYGTWDGSGNFTATRPAWNAEIAKLETALAAGDYAYGGYQGAYDSIYERFGKPAGVSPEEAQGVIGGMYDKYFAPAAGETIAPTPTPTDTSGYTAADITYLQGIKRDYEDQLARLGTTQEQGNKRIADEYGRELDSANVSKANQLNAYGENRQQQTGIKGKNYSQINNAANKGYNSLASILGRASGTGSSAFQQLLPNLIGKDVFSKRTAANNVYGENVRGIDQAEKGYLTSFDELLDDLKRQKDDNERQLLTGVNETRANINSKLATAAGQLAAARGGGVAQIRAAQDPYSAQVTESRNTIDSLFDKYFRPYTPKQVTAAAPELSNYTMDRSLINAGKQGAVDPTNPYADMLRKRLSEEQI